MYIKNFWKILPSIFTLDFWRVNPKLKKLSKYLSGSDLYIAKKWAKEKGYEWDSTWYLDGEKYLNKDGCNICMVQPMFPKFLTRYTAWQPDGEEKTNLNKTFLLNHNKTANFFFQEFILKECIILYEREMKYWEMNKRIAKEGQKYIKSNDFLYDLHYLSIYNYYDIIDLKNNTLYTAKEKKQFMGDFCDFTNVELKDYITEEESEVLDAKGEEYDWNWTGDIIPTALSKAFIDSVLVINPSKLYGVKVTKELLKRMKKLFFGVSLKINDKYEITNHLESRYTNV